MADSSKIISPRPERPTEINIETAVEKIERSSGETKKEPFDSALPAAVVPSMPSAAPAISPETQLQKKVEQVLEEGLEQLYNELPQDDKVKFRRLGEETAVKITALLQQVKVKISQILSLIRRWLLSITGINRYFVEQEAKIKAEKILKLKE